MTIPASVVFQLGIRQPAAASEAVAAHFALATGHARGPARGNFMLRDELMKVKPRARSQESTAAASDSPPPPQFWVAAASFSGWSPGCAVAGPLLIGIGWLVQEAEGA